MGLNVGSSFLFISISLLISFDIGLCENCTTKMLLRCDTFDREKKMGSFVPKTGELKDFNLPFEMIVHKMLISGSCHYSHDICVCTMLNVNSTENIVSVLFVNASRKNPSKRKRFWCTTTKNTWFGLYDIRAFSNSQCVCANIFNEIVSTRRFFSLEYLLASPVQHLFWCVFINRKRMRLLLLRVLAWTNRIKNAILFIRVIEWIRFSDVCMPWCGKYFIQNYVHISNKAFRCKTNKLMTVIPSQVEFNPFDYLTFCVTSEVPKKKSWHRKNAHYCVVEQRDKTSPIFRTELYRKMRFMSGSV